MSAEVSKMDQTSVFLEHAGEVRDYEKFLYLTSMNIRSYNSEIVKKYNRDLAEPYYAVSRQLLDLLLNIKRDGNDWIHTALNSTLQSLGEVSAAE